MEEPETTEQAAQSAGANAGKRNRLARVARVAGHPLAILTYLVAFSLAVGENYPFTPYPMYSGTASKTHYFFIEDENGEPVGTARTFRVTTPKVKKMYTKFAEQLARERKLKSAKKLSEEGRRLAGEQLLDHLRTLGPKGESEKQELARPFTLVRVDVRLEDGKFTKTREVVVEGY